MSQTLMNSTSLTPFDIATAIPPRADTIPTYKPVPEDERMVRDALAFLVIKAPFFAHLVYNEMHIAYIETDASGIKWAATDARTIFINVKEMRAAKWTLANIAFVIAHECAHAFLMDLVMAVRWRADGHVMCKSGNLPYIHDLMNMAEDFRINAMLIESKCGKMPDVGLYDKTISEKGMEAAIDIYEKLYQQAKKQGGGAGGYGQPGNGKSGAGSGFDIHLTPSAKAAKADPGRMQQAIAAAAAAAEATGQGTIPSAVRRLLGEILDPKVSWQDHLRSTIIRKGGDPLYDWRYLDRHWLSRPTPQYFAKQAHSGAGCVVIVGDTSGSIDGPMLQRFFAEMNGIVLDLNPAELHVLWCDAHLHRVDTLEEVDDLLEYKEVIESDGGPGGGGGTSFKPPFKWVEEQGLVPDMLIYLTDTYGSFPDHEPDYPVIWASIVKDPTVPWGTVVEVEL
jgi:predicted metal-dependent peptidase